MMRIGEFAGLAKISVRALRHYEATGLLKPAHIDPRSRYRYYDVKQLATLERLLLLRELGISLGAIRELLPASSAQFRFALSRHRAALRQQMAEREILLARVSALEAWLDAEERESSGLIVRTKSYPAVRALTLRAQVASGSNAVTDMFEDAERRARRWRADHAPLLLMHGAPQSAAQRDIEVCVPVSASCRLRGVRDIEPEQLAASVAYSGPYTQPADMYRRMRTWLGRQRLALAERPIREIYHRFGADQNGYSLPAHRLATSPGGYVTELAIPVVRRPA